ncbi:hypothetical protein QYS48_31090 [Marivirga arenosa]|uniref:Sulfotransferase domain-containing protein n=1 Tax=Marivirga arenosa TaxID=3059076 RepID=A0AA51N5E2_9BACT|nr:hypothetical protein [Marivirga sp. ABR2-2]WMN05950.1 hypothetical protein QYS48_31090 [Marivirga sp. ABR2-2]
MSKSSPELYFHVGLGKTASTFLQDRFFPKLKGIHYTPSNIYRFFPKIIKKGSYDRYLFSREFDRQFYDETQKIVDISPDTNIIIILRKHDSWIASQYRRYVKNGGKQDFEQFIDLEKDQGAWKQKDLYFYPMLEFIKEKFTKQPLVLFHEDLKKDQKSFLDRIANYLKAEYNISDINLNPKHTAYSDHQLQLVKRYSPIDKDNETHYSNRIWTFITYRSKWLINHLVLYSANLIPKSKNENLVSVEHQKRINTFYQEDWNRCIDFAQKYSA